MVNLEYPLSFVSTGLIVLLASCVVGETSIGKEVDANTTEEPTIDAMPGAPDSMPTPTADARPPLDEMVTITFSTQETASANYEPRNIVAVWIEDSTGAFVQTLDRQGNEEKEHLVAWNEASGGDETDATTSATRATHNDAISLTWDMPDGMADGVYTIQIETADSNSGGGQMNNQGTFTYDKNGTADTQTGLSDGGHSNVTIDYTGR